MVRTRVQLEFFEILGLVLSQTTTQIFKWDDWMVPSGEKDVTLSFFFSCVGHMMRCRLSFNKP